MSRDIRSFFSSSAKKNVEKKEETDIVASKKRKKIISIESDSDDDLFVVKKKGKPVENKKPVEKKEKKEEIEDVSSFFGSKPAKRSTATTSSTKESSPKKSKTVVAETKRDKKNQSTRAEARAHDDDDFIATLKELDNKKTPPKAVAKKSEPSIEDEFSATLKQLDRKKSPSKEVSKKSEPKPEPRRSPRKEHKKIEETDDFKPSKKEKPTPVSKSSPKPLPKEKSKGKVKLEIETSVKKQKESPEKEDAALEEIWEKKKQQSDNYRKFLQRKGPAHLGEKEIPEGAENCMAGLTFVITGVLDSLDRDGAAELVQKYGGKVTASISKNTSYLLAGEDAGPSKLEKAKSMKIPVVDEDGFLELIKTLPSAEAKPGKQNTPKSSKNTPNASKNTPKAEKKESQSKEEKIAAEKMTPPKVKPVNGSQKSAVGSQRSATGSQISTTSSPGAGSQKTLPPSPAMSAGSGAMWVDKYKPQSTKHIIGQQADRSVAKKLMQWLQDWDKNHSNPKEKKPRPAPWAKNDNGAAFKAALLSGPPGIGKTTTVQLVCKELGFDIVEFNASDTRSKKSLHQEVSEMLSTQCLSGLFQGNTKNALSKKRVLLMEEVDGMAGNEDRGGMAELILLIKAARVPVICTCNDRGHQKIRSLANYCFDLRVQKPKLEQIRAAMLSLCFKEKVTIPKDALDAIIVGTNFDVRQIIHMMSLWAAGQAKVETDVVQKESKKSKKEFKLGIWDVTPKVFSAEFSGKNAIYDKTNLFFQDYSLGPLFVQENYLSAVHGVTGLSGPGSMRKKLDLMSKAADSLAKGDLVEKLIRSNQAWSLLPVQAVYSTVTPGIVLRGRLTSQAMFPSWLGKNSKRNKFDRYASELQMHMRLTITGSKKAVVMDYLNPIQNQILTPLTSRGADGVTDAIDAMVEYNLIRDDLDKISELSTWGSGTSAWQKVDGKIKAQLTRQYNKMPIMTPFATQTISGGAKKAVAKSDEDYLDEDEEGVESEVEDDDAGKDSMIKAKKVTAAKPSKGESSKGKAKAPAKQPASKKGKK